MYRLISIMLLAFTCACTPDAEHKSAAGPEPEGQNMFGHYLTRGLTKTSDNLADGYVLFIPPASAAAYLINRKGEVVYSWKGNYPLMGAYLQNDGSLILNAHDPDFPIFAGGGQTGRIQHLAADGTIEWDFEYADELQHAHHDFAVMPNGNILLIAWEAKSVEEAVQAGRNPEFIPNAGVWPDKIVEIHPTDKYHGEVVWEWHFWDHMIQDFDPSMDNYGNPAEHPELLDINASAHLPPPISADSMKVLHKMKQAWRNETVDNRGSDIHHVNAINYNPELDQIVFSSPSLSEIFIIDHSTTTKEAAGHSGGRSGRGGDLLYRWGNPANYRAGDSTDQVLFHQHDVRWVEPGLQGAGNLTVFNNELKMTAAEKNEEATENEEDEEAEPLGYSAVLEIAPPANDNGGYVIGENGRFGPDRPVWSYIAPDSVSFFSSFISGAHRMPNGNTFINEGARGRFFEVTPDGEIVWEYLNPYRGPVREPNGDEISPMPMTYWLFRATFIPADHPGLKGLDLSPLDPQPEEFRLPPPPPSENEDAS